MFLKARQWLRMILLTLLAQIGNLAKVTMRKEYEVNYANQRKLQHIKEDFELRPKSHLNGPAGVPVDDPSNYQLSLTGKFEPASHLPTIELSDNSRSGRGSCNMCEKCRNAP